MDIKKLPDNERPREKLMMHGASSLSDVELLAILLSTGTKELPVIALAEKLIESDGAGLLFLADCVPEELCKLSGIGKAKSCQLVAAIELGKRIAKKPKGGVYTASGPDKAAMFVMEELRYLRREIFLVMMLNSRGEIIAIEKVAEGSLNTAGIRAREIFNIAVRKSAFAVILVHNHPSGDPTPSDSDIESTQKLIEAGDLIGIPIADHIIIGDGNFYSFKEKKIM